MKKEVFISVDVEADGPIPGDYSMSSLGACLISSVKVGFYRELKPISDKFIPEAVRVSGLDRNRLVIDGTEPRVAMEQFADWLQSVCGTNHQPVFVALNATFDWMFVHWYFVHFCGQNPFGIAGWDIMAYYAGITRKCSWAEAKKERMENEFLSLRPHTHNALDDAREQAEIFQRLLHRAYAS